MLYLLTDMAINVLATAEALHCNYLSWATMLYIYYALSTYIFF